MCWCNQRKSFGNKNSPELYRNAWGKWAASNNTPVVIALHRIQSDALQGAAYLTKGIVGLSGRPLWHVTHSALCNGPFTRYVKLRVAHAPGMPGKFSPPPQISDSDMHHGTCVTHVPWCMPGSLTSGFPWNRCGENGAWATRNLPIWQEAHWWDSEDQSMGTHRTRDGMSYNYCS